MKKVNKQLTKVKKIAKIGKQNETYLFLDMVDKVLDDKESNIDVHNKA